VDSLTGENSGDNLGPGTPIIHFEQWEHDEVQIKLILKGGGCENKNIQYSLPTEIEGLGKAGRDMDGVRKCILHPVYQAQGQGCSAGFIGVSIGGDRTSGYSHAKEQLFRTLDDVNPVPELAKMEEYILEKANTLGIGTMGFGGEVTLLGCKVGVQNRLPASFFVSVAYNCWAFRRLGININPANGEITKWHYKNEVPLSDEAPESDMQLTGKEVKLETPLTKDKVKNLKVGDVVLISGEMYTGRDAIHKHLMTNEAPFDLNGQVLYHCGPVVLKDENDEWQIKAAGPTTSIREEPYQAEVIKKFGIKAIIGKGGMGDKTLKALKEESAVYLNAIGGAAQYYSKCIKKVKGVELLEFGMPEAMWRIEVKDFPAIVTMDANGNSLHKDVDKSSLDKLAAYKEPVFV
ncbi:MAG TPA: fumarate hydratase, partial [Vampirovibrionales bacterium]